MNIKKNEEGDMRILRKYLRQLHKNFHDRVRSIMTNSDKDIRKVLRECVQELLTSISNICDKWFSEHFKVTNPGYYNKKCFQGAVLELKDSFESFSAIDETSFLVR